MDMQDSLLEKHAPWICLLPVFSCRKPVSSQVDLSELIESSCGEEETKQ
jgi:hypothetical protein